MPRKTTTRADQGPSLWEADQMDLQAYVDSRLTAEGDTPSEPAWFSAAFDASWPFAFAEAEVWRA